MRLGILLYLSLCCALSSPPSLRACDVPVYRYALENWPADPYETILFHRQPLNAEDRRLLVEIETTIDGDNPLNLLLRTVDLSAPVPPPLQQIWEREQTAELPRLVVRYALDPPQADAVWSAPLTAESVRQLLDSPVRREIARRLVDGQNGVWLFLGSGDPARDEPLTALLRDQLQAEEQRLQLPVPQDADPETVAANADLRIEFSLLPLSRNDPAEQFLVAMLLHSEWDLFLTDEPIAFPVFGRGRILYALVGAGITPDNIHTAGTFLVGPCSCQVKDQCPGRDLLMAVDWTAQIDTQLPSFAEVARATALLDTTALAAKSDAAPNPLRRNLLLLLLTGSVGLVVGTLVVKLKSSSSGDGK